MASPKPGMGKGVLDPKRRVDKFLPRRFFPSETLAPAVRHFWEVTWDLPSDGAFTQKTIPYPAVHVVAEQGRREVVGPITGLFERCIEGRGRVFGAHMRPGMFRAISKVPVSQLVDRRPSWHEVLPITRSEAQEVADEILSSPADESSDVFDRLMQRWFAEVDLAPFELTRDLVHAVETDPMIKRASDLAERAGCSLRTLQRRFRDHVGHSPKFVIQRFRLLEAAERLTDDPQSGAAIAAELGFADQAHFIRAFKKLVGASPAAYTRRNLG